jgi:hypothetical protein
MAVPVATVVDGLRHAAAQIQARRLDVVIVLQSRAISHRPASPGAPAYMVAEMDGGVPRAADAHARVGRTAAPAVQALQVGDAVFDRLDVAGRGLEDGPQARVEVAIRLALRARPSVSRLRKESTPCADEGGVAAGGSPAAGDLPCRACQCRPGLGPRRPRVGCRGRCPGAAGRSPAPAWR